MIKFHYCPVRGLVWFDIQPLPVDKKSGAKYNKRDKYGRFTK